jgi:hypothetical protein
MEQYISKRFLVGVVLLFFTAFGIAWWVSYATHEEYESVIFNNTELDMNIYSVGLPWGHGDLKGEIKRRATLKPAHSTTIRHSGIFVAESKGEFHKYPVAFVVWNESDIQAYGGFYYQRFQVNSGGQLLVLRDDEAWPVVDVSKQPQGYPLQPVTIENLDGIRVWIDR